MEFGNLALELVEDALEVVGLALLGVGAERVQARTFLLLELEEFQQAQPVHTGPD